jgi:hypothetical protein
MCFWVSYMKKYEEKKFTSLKSLKKGVGSGSIRQSYGSRDPDPRIWVRPRMSRIPNTGLKNKFYLCTGNCMHILNVYYLVSDMLQSVIAQAVYLGIKWHLTILALDINLGVLSTLNCVSLGRQYLN